MEILDLLLTQTQLYGLIFLLGSFSVATLSDIKTMTAQREFLEIWILFSLAFLAYDVHTGYTHGADILLYIKWGLIVLFVISWAFGIFFKIAPGDAFAVVAVMTLLTPPFIVFFYIILKIIDIIFRPFLKLLFGDKKGYPFMPVVTVAVAITFFVGLYLIDWIGASL